MKKILVILLYIAFLIGGLFLFDSQILTNILSKLESSNQSMMMTGFQILADYFSAADTWNWIFVLLAIATALDLYVLIDITIAWLFKKLWLVVNNRRRININDSGDSESQIPNKPFVEQWWFAMTFQKILSLLILFAFFVLTTNIYVNSAGTKKSITDITRIEGAKPTLVLGTSKMLSSGKGENLYYRYRINTAKDLWDAGKVDYFIISGDGTGADHKDGNYDEIRDITNDLLAEGIPQEKIKKDTAGYRTLDSMLRIRNLFCTQELLIISQSFHVNRAVVLASFYGIKPTGVPSAGTETFSMAKREILSSKPKLMLDLLFANMQPKVEVKSDCMKTTSYRSSFSVKSDLHIILMLLIGVAFVTSIGLMFKYIA